MTEFTAKDLTKLHVIYADGAVATYFFKPGDERLSFGVPGYEWLKASVFKDTSMDIEHVAVTYQGKDAHMFVDENGIAKGLPMNVKATGVYYNREQLRAGLETYDDLTEDPVTPPTYDPRYRIVGLAALWLGDME